MVRRRNSCFELQGQALLIVWQGVSAEQAFSDGKRQFQEGLPNGPSAFLKNMSDTARDMKQKVINFLLSCE